MTKTILCYGDSNTWGMAASLDGGRLPYEQRWPTVMQARLGEGYRVIPEGLSGRTTVWDEPAGDVTLGDRSGRRHLNVALESHMPLDLVVIMLGTNDLKARYSAGAFDIAQGAGMLADIARRSTAGPDLLGPPQVLLISPPPLGKLDERGAAMFAGAKEKLRDMPRWFAFIAEERGCEWMDAAAVTTTSGADGIHLEADDHLKLGMAVADKVREILG